MTTPEGRVKNLVKAACNEAGAYYLMPVQNGMGSPTVDFLICHRGWFIAVETKAQGKRPTKRQELTLDAMRRAGAVVLVVDGPDTLKPLVALLEGLDHAHP